MPTTLQLPAAFDNKNLISRARQIQLWLTSNSSLSDTARIPRIMSQLREFGSTAGSQTRNSYSTSQKVREGSEEVAAVRMRKAQAGVDWTFPRPSGAKTNCRRFPVTRASEISKGKTWNCLCRMKFPSQPLSLPVKLEEWQRQQKAKAIKFLYKLLWSKDFSHHSPGPRTLKQKTTERPTLCTHSVLGKFHISQTAWPVIKFTEQ